MAQNALFCVVAIRPDGTRIILARNLTKDRAQAIVDSLSGVSAFADLYIEPQIKHNAGSAAPGADEADGAG
jgi:hypothetical protein